MGDTHTKMAETGQKLRETEEALAQAIDDMAFGHAASVAGACHSFGATRGGLRMAIAAYSDALIAHHNAVEAAKAASPGYRLPPADNRPPKP